MLYPMIKISVCDHIITQGVDFEIVSTKAMQVDFAYLKINLQIAAVLKIVKDDIITIEAGFDGALKQVFKGYVADYNAKLGLLLAKDEMIKLTQKSVSASFLSVIPQEIVQYCLSISDITSYKIADTIYPKIAVVPIEQMTVLDALYSINQIWQIPVKFYFLDSVFYWGVSPTQDNVYHFVYANNIFELTYFNGVWELVTVLINEIRHTDVIDVTHPKLTGSFTVDKVKMIADSGTLKVHLFFRST